MTDTEADVETVRELVSQIDVRGPPRILTGNTAIFCQVAVRTRIPVIAVIVVDVVVVVIQRGAIRDHDAGIVILLVVGAVIGAEGIFGAGVREQRIDLFLVEGRAGIP